MSHILDSNSVSTEQLRLQNVELHARLVAQSKVLFSLERRVERSLETLQAYLDQLKAVGMNLGCGDELSLMEAEICRLCDLLSDATLLQKLEAGKVVVNLDVLDAHLLLDSVSRHLLEPRDGSRSRLTSQIAPSLPLIHADQDLTEAVLVDLLSRGLKYSDPDVSIVLGAEATSAHLHIMVCAQRFAPIGHREFATEIALCCKRIEVQGGEVTCKIQPDGLNLVTVSLPIAVVNGVVKGGDEAERVMESVC